jgi:hypothetical protein
MGINYQQTPTHLNDRQSDHWIAQRMGIRSAAYLRKLLASA